MISLRKRPSVLCTVQFKWLETKKPFYCGASGVSFKFHFFLWISFKVWCEKFKSLVIYCFFSKPYILFLFYQLTSFSWTYIYFIHFLLFAFFMRSLETRTREANFKFILNIIQMKMCSSFNFAKLIDKTED